MANTTGVLSNVRVGFASSSPVSWTVIPKIVNVTPVKKTTDDVDTTVYSTDKYRTSIPGFTSLSDLEVEMLADMDELNASTGTVQHTLWGLQVAQTDVYVRYEIMADAAGTKWTAFEFTAKVASWEPSDLSIGSAMKLKVVFKNADTYFNKIAAGSSSLA